MRQGAAELILSRVEPLVERGEDTLSRDAGLKRIGAPPEVRQAGIDKGLDHEHVVRQDTKGAPSLAIIAAQITADVERGGLIAERAAGANGVLNARACAAAVEAQIAPVIERRVDARRHVIERQGIREGRRGVIQRPCVMKAQAPAHKGIALNASDAREARIDDA
ncbi:hypothetical protein KKF91_21565 [Myxococcota bacterium]|nr:hypothetical protein [Myxococcota bacterium]MBU1898530.1 hypothetical protein [Myxococcota bacterium]